MTRARRALPPSHPDHWKRQASFAALLFAAIVFGWLHAQSAIGMAATEKDFGRFYASTRAFVDGRTLYEVAENLNPPHLHLLLLPLAQLSPAMAWTIWGVASLAAFLISLRIIVREIALELTPWRIWVSGALLVSSAATGAVIINGQIAWLLMLPMTLAWAAARHARWGSAGALLGLSLSVKPFLLIVVPFLLLHRKWRALAAAGLTAGAAVGIGLVVFGSGAYWSWMEALRAVSGQAARASAVHSPWIESLRVVGWQGLPINASVFGFLARSFQGTEFHAPLIRAPQLVVPLWFAAAALIGTITFASIWKRLDDADGCFALLLVAALLISPLGWIYYGWLALGPVAAVAVHRGANDPRRPLFSIAIGGMLWPILATRLFQPAGWATVTIGSVYCWSMLTLWIALLREPRSTVS